MALPQSERRVRLERLLAKAKAPLHLTPVTRDRAQAEEWLAKFEGAGLDGVIAKLESRSTSPASGRC
jgi:ATP-dependent DNA ligase